MDNSTVIRDARIAADLTQEELAEIVGLKQSAVSKWERNIAAPRLKTKRGLERALGLADGSLGTARERRGPLKGPQKRKTPAAGCDEGQNHADHASADRVTNG